MTEQNETVDPVQQGLGMATMDQILDEVGRRYPTAVLVYHHEHRNGQQGIRYSWRSRAPHEALGMMQIAAPNIMQGLHGAACGVPPPIDGD